MPEGDLIAHKVLELDSGKKSEPPRREESALHKIEENAIEVVS